MLQAIKVPEIGENVESGVVVAVHISVGDTIAVDDTVIELETDKALVEIPSPFNGRITEILAKAGAQMNVGDVIARVESEGHTTTDVKDEPAPHAVTDDPDAIPESVAKSPAAAPPGALVEQPSAPEAAAADRPPVPAAPSVRRLARELGVDIYTVRGSGSGGRILAADIKTHVRRGQSGATAATAMLSPDTPSMPDFSRWGPVEVLEMDTVRRITAASTTVSWATIPHVTQFDEADITGVTAFIQKHAAAAENVGAKLTVTPIITRVCAEALKRFPRFNASIDIANRSIIFKRYVHIGIAADTPRGLLVPVVRDADRKSILDLAKSIGDLAARARNKKLTPDEMEGGTFSISNQGGIGGVGFTPIVLWPQVAILGISRSAVKPHYTGAGFEPRTRLPLSLSYDHRIIDGADAARFLRWICDALEQPLTLFFE